MTNLLTSLGRLLTLRNLIILIGIIALIAAVWLLGPRLEVEGSHPLAPLEMRALATALIVAVPLLIGGIRLWRVRRAKRRLTRDLSTASQLTPLPDSHAAAETEELRERFEAALAALRESSFEGTRERDLVYEIPCYALIGAARSGKTTLLRNSGLRSPLASRTASDAVGAFGGTPSCQLWLTEEAIIFDIAGADLAQGAGQDLGRAGWQSLLALLEKDRPRRPLNGIIVTLSAENLMSEGAEARRARALKLRRGLQEMLRSLSVRLPVYLVVTKADLISGFAEFFDFLPAEARRQIWGIPLAADFDLGRPGAAAALEAGMHDLLERVSARRADAMRNEHDLSRCERIFGFPEQLANLFPLLCEVTAEIFRPARHEVKPQLRGVFLTSGTQTDWALDRAFARAAASIDLAPARQVQTSGHAGPFFINRLLSGFILAESGLAGPDSRLERRTARRNAFGWATAIAIVVLMTGVWGYAAQDNRKMLRGDQASAEQLLAAERSLAPGASLPETLPVLDQAAALAGRYDEDDIVFLAQGAGLSASAEVAPHARAMYDRVLLGELMPRLMRALETQLRNASSDGSQEALRQDLEVYLMMGDPERFRRSLVTGWFANDWARQYSFQPEVRDDLEGHLSALMTLMPQAQSLDDQLVASARAALVQVPAAQQIYATLRREAAADPELAPFSLADALGPQAVLSLTATGTAGLRAEIPGFYTRSGFETYILRRLPLMLGDMVQTDWVMGSTAAANNSKVSGLGDQVAKLYATDYVTRWQQLVDSLRLRKFANLQSALQGFDNLSGVSSPLTRLIAAIRDNTDLEPPGQSQAKGTAAAAKGAAKKFTSQSAGNLVASLSGAATSAGAAIAFTTWPGDAIRTPFAPLIALGSTSSGTEPIDQVRKLLAGATGLLQSVASAPSPAAAAYQLALAGGAGGPGNALTALRTQASTYPPVIARILDTAASDASAVLNGLAGSHVAAAWRDAGGGQCQAQIAGRFPIERSATSEIALDDFKSFFGPGGVMDSFQKKYLQSLASSGAAGAGSGGQGVVDAATLQAFHQAARIRTAFFDGGKLQVNYGLTPTFLDPRALQVTLEIGSDQLVYRHEPPRQQQMVWPSADSGVSYTLIDLNKQAHSQTLAGSWALFRMVDQAGKVDPSDKSAVDVSLSVDKLTASYRLDTSSLASAFDPSVVQGFQCPDMG